MLEALAAARRAVTVEMYTFADDVTGRRFADVLADRARAGVPVRLIYDAVGSLDTPAAFFARLREAGVAVAEFNPIFSLRRKRDHRKLVIADDRAFVGGINWKRDYDAPSVGGLGWRDMAIELHGPIVGDLHHIFAGTWRRLTRERLPDEAPSEAGEIPVAAVSSERWGSRRSISRSYLHAIRSARKRLWIMNAYFVPARRFVRALRGAARRGVDVRVLVPAHTDIRPVWHATRALYSPLMRAGVRLYEWQGPMLHAKTAVIDGLWCTIGSYNLDHLSLFHNLELTVIAVDPKLAARMEAIFEEDLRRAFEVDPVVWRRRGFGRRALEQFFYFWRALL